MDTPGKNKDGARNVVPPWGRGEKKRGGPGTRGWLILTKRGIFLSQGSDDFNTPKFLTFEVKRTWVVRERHVFELKNAGPSLPSKDISQKNSYAPLSLVEKIQANHFYRQKETLFYECPMRASRKPKNTAWTPRNQGARENSELLMWGFRERPNTDIPKTPRGNKPGGRTKKPKKEINFRGIFQSKNNN